MPKIDLTQLSFTTIIESMFIVATIVILLGSLYKFVVKFANRVNMLFAKKEKTRQTIKKHTEDINDINEKINNTDEKIDALIESFHNFEECQKIQTRHSIVRSAEDSIKDGKIDFYRLTSIEDMYSMYTELLHGNSYVKTIMKKVRNLEVVGKDETEEQHEEHN